MADAQNRSRPDRRARQLRRAADRRARARRRGRTRRFAGSYRGAAQERLRRFRRRTALAVAVTGLLLMVLGAPVGGQGVAGDTAAEARAADSVADPARAVEEATGTLRDLWLTFQGLLPKIVIALVLLAVAAVLSRVIRAVLRRLLRSYSRAEALSALAGIGVWFVAVAVALSVLAGDVRTLLGSIGLVGLALSWALQTPIESFTGWLLNSFRQYYRVGDRIAVGDVFGDVYAIDFLTTTVWEAGGADKSVRGEQPTGALITFPNAEILRANLTNFTRDFPFVWDEVRVGVSNDSDVRLAMDVMATVANATVGEVMAAPAERYVTLLRHEGLDYDIAVTPKVFVEPTDSWIDLTLRYLVPARERRHWSTALHLAIAEAFAAPEHRTRIHPSYPRRQVQMLDGRE